MKINEIIHILNDPEQKFRLFAAKGFYNHLPDDQFLKKAFNIYMHKELNLDNPETYNEKLQWLKLHDRKDRYVTMVDKYEVKKYVSKIIGDEYIIPTIGIWDNFDDIDFRKLPQEFVIKCTHDSGGLVIVNDERKFNRKAAKKKIQKALKRKYYYLGREWPYKYVKPRIIAEQYMEDKVAKELRDYKFFCFDGVPKALFIASERQDANEETKFDFFDMNGNHLPLTNGHPNAKKTPALPMQFEKMKELASKLSKDIPHVRVDFYEINGKIYFGELTFFHWSGFVPFAPEEWDYKFGEWITLPEPTPAK